MNKNFDNLDKFFELINSQFAYGGKKYAADNTRESTDILFDWFGFRFSLGNVAKYVFRYGNLKRERDLLKIACYQFIYYMKRGFHMLDYGTKYPVDTTVILKTESYPNFVKKVNDYAQENEKELLSINNKMESIKYMLKDMASINMQWSRIRINDFLKIFILSYFEWNENFSNLAGQDQDVYLTTDNK